MSAHPLPFVVGVGSSSRSELWRESMSGIQGVAVVEQAHGRDFWRKAGLDIEIMATSNVVVRLDIGPPFRLSYRLDRDDYAPIVLVPPVLPPRLEDWPPHLADGARAVGYSPGPDSNRDKWREWLSKFGYDLALWNWRRVFGELKLVLRSEPRAKLHAGLHCDTIGYFNITTASEEREVLEAFQLAYGDFRRGGTTDAD